MSQDLLLERTNPLRTNSHHHLSEVNTNPYHFGWKLMEGSNVFHFQYDQSDFWRALFSLLTLACFSKP